MRFLLLLLLSVSTAFGQNIVNSTNRDKIFYPETYGARPDDAVDDRLDIQEALDAAETAGGGVVRLGIGTYKIVLVRDDTTTFESGGTKSKSAGHYGLEIPAGVVLEGKGMDATELVSYVGSASGNTGCMISPKGMRSTVVAYACGGGTIRDFAVSANDIATNQNDSCILVSMVHSDNFRIERIRFGDVRAHGLEIDYTRGLTVIDCVFDGEHPGTSGSWVQCDAGLAGPYSWEFTSTDPALISASTAPIRDTRFIRCRFLQRPATDTYSKDIDLAHGGCHVYNLTFEDCDFYGRDNAVQKAIVVVDASAGAIHNDLAFLNCRFTVYGTTSAAESSIYLVNNSFTTGEAQRWRIEGCEFRGGAKNHLQLGNSSTSTITGSTWGKQSGYSIRNNRFIFNAADANTDKTTSMLLMCLKEATIEGNIVETYGTNAAANFYHYRIYGTSGVIRDNKVDHRADVANSSSYVFVIDTTAGEAACQAATIPGWRCLVTGNSSISATASDVVQHFYMIGSSVAGGSTYSFQQHGNTTMGTGTAYNLTNQDYAGSTNAANVFIGAATITGNITSGGAASASPVAKTFTLGESSRSGTDSNVGGASGTITSGTGTGTGTASSLIFQTPTVAGSGTGAQSLTTRLTLSSTAGTFTAPVILPAYTVATLPAGTVGMVAYVTDATAPTYLGALTGGGAVKCPVFYNGTAWVSQ